MSWKSVLAGGVSGTFLMYRQWSTYLVTRETFKSVSILSLKQVDNETVIPLFVDLPLFLCCNGWWQRLQQGLPFGRHLDRWWPVLDTVQILVQPIQ